MLVLVGYASEHGSTRGIAERVALVLAETGIAAEARPVADVGDAGVYDAFVLGSAVHANAWLPDASRFVGRNRALLTERPVWLFSVGLARVVGGWFEAHSPEPREVSRWREELRPREHRTFAGALLKEHLPGAGRLAYRMMHGRYGDFRNWPEIDDWAQDIARSLPAGTRTTGTRTAGPARPADHGRRAS
ncbi:flavodoxin domain-containing protein [Streptomyces sp. NPDC059506]|uniref:flavodoxin domain-containing protein n=1 Tax=Streptomyces TaxID=1883 RepID=UPI000CC0B330|nr:flavodoxin domain-containing protein [Streptomyces sp. SCUT-3]PLW66427.1 flavodoxin [Streptomyces sp. DJ]QMV24378.1 flavodoxin [Streptomyces sp. SCUT-3]